MEGPEDVSRGNEMVGSSTVPFLTSSRGHPSTLGSPLEAHYAPS